MPELIKKLFAAVVASFAAPICGGVISCFSGTYFDASISGLFSVSLALLVGVIPSAFGAIIQAPVPYLTVVFTLVGLPLFMSLWSLRRLSAVSVLLIGLLIGMLLFISVEFFPAETRHYVPYVPREPALLTIIWAFLTGVLGSYLLWYVGFNSEEG